MHYFIYDDLSWKLEAGRSFVSLRFIVNLPIVSTMLYKSFLADNEDCFFIGMLLKSLYLSLINEHNLLSKHFIATSKST